MRHPLEGFRLGSEAEDQIRALTSRCERQRPSQASTKSELVRDQQHDGPDSGGCLCVVPLELRPHPILGSEVDSGGGRSVAVVPMGLGEAQRDSKRLIPIKLDDLDPQLTTIYH